jgi:CRP-like cAMP-binding protein
MSVPSTPLVARLGRDAELGAGDVALLDHMTRNATMVPADRQLQSEGDEPQVLHVILDGLACRYKILADGRRQITAFLVPGDLCDFHVFLLPRVDDNVATLAPSLVASVPRQEVEAALAERPVLARAFWSSLLRDVSILREWLVNVGRRSAYERMAHLLWELYLRHAAVGKVSEGAFHLPLTQADLADALGLSTVYVNKTITRLRASGIIETDRRQIRVLRPEELSMIAGSEGGYLCEGGAAVKEAMGGFRGGQLRRL